MSAGRVLVVDDDRSQAQDLAILLGRLVPCQAIATAVPDEALAAAGTSDLIVSDLMMPGRDGLALLAQIKTVAPKCEVIVVTVAPSLSSAVSALRLGAVDYVKRDLGEDWLENLVDTARAALRRRPSLRAPGYHREHLIAFFFDRLAMRVKEGALGSFPPGMALEYLVKLLLDSCEGFEATFMRHKTIDEELDIVCLNHSGHPLWARHETVIVVECKDRGRTRPGANERGRLEQKIRNRQGRATVGIFVSTSGFASTFQARRSSAPVAGGAPPLVITIDANGLADWIDASDRLGWLTNRAVEMVLT